MAGEEIRKRVEALVEPVIADLGLELVDIDYRKGKRAHLCIYIDKPGGVTIDDCEKVSRALSPLLDQRDPLPGSRYLLEVSSPGVERPLRRERDFVRFAGEAVKIYTGSAIQGRRKFAGTLLGADNGEISIQLEEDGRRVTIPMEMVTKAHLWYRPEKG
ncbi:MAG TPA: ribosome maturation factor RimP [Bacillota bacterium]|nr:ribosome maturation factor RimP [Bacillota bacterium]HQD05816.1 ribosome maturation factor RimP [Bacillota bacterium]